MQKRGQITVYIIVGVVLLIAMGGLFALRSGLIQSGLGQRSSEISSVPSILSEVEDEIKTCTNTFIEDSIYTLAGSGGILSETNSVNFEGYDVPYLIDSNKRNLLPSVQSMNTELERYINVNLAAQCGTNSEAQFGAVVSKVDIKGDKVFVTINWPITISRGGTTGTIDRLPFEYEISLGNIREVANTVIENQIQYYPRVCLSCMSQLGFYSDVVIERYIEGNNQIYYVIDNNDNRLVFGYAVKYVR